MDTEKISKLLWTEYNSPDNLLGKELLLELFPNVREHFVEYGGAKNIDRSFLLGINIFVPGERTCLSFDKRYFPELWKENKNEE